jgi:4-carboxymuconolactone decarboxylase
MANTEPLPLTPMLDDMRSVSPALARYTSSTLLGDLWKRPQLSARDRGIVTLSVLIARNQTGALVASGQVPQLT